jgi:hypothetical protein
MSAESAGSAIRLLHERREEGKDYEEVRNSGRGFKHRTPNIEGSVRG